LAGPSPVGNATATQPPYRAGLEGAGRAGAKPIVQDSAIKPMHRCMGRLDEVFSLRLGFVSFGGQWQHVRTGALTLWLVKRFK